MTKGLIGLEYKKQKKAQWLLRAVHWALLLILLIVICLPLTVPKAFHYHVYTVISGSMEPAIPTGSLVYIKEMEPKDVQVDDVIAFYGTKDAASIITHRVVENRVLMGEFITKVMLMQQKI